MRRARTERSEPCKRVLVVEDDRVINDQVTERLRAEGYLVTQAFDGPSAVRSPPRPTRRWCCST